jgi:hypothetical protein
MKKMLLVAVMLLVAGAAYAETPVVKKVECSVKGKAASVWVKTSDACKALGGTVVEAKKVS